MRNGLPKGWAEPMLPRVVYFQEGPGLRKWQFGEAGIPFLNIRTFENGRINRSKCQFVKREEFEGKYEHFLLKEGDIVVSSSGTLGKIAVTRPEDLPLMLNTSTIRFRSIHPELLTQDFLRFFLKSHHFYRQIESAKTGSAIFNYGPAHLKQMRILLPPLGEQRRIAAKLDMLLGKVDDSQKRLAKIPMILKRFRQAVLAAACSGRLTADWREKELHTYSSNQPSDANDDLPNSWSLRAIRDLASSAKGSIQSGPFGSNLLHSEFQPTGILVIGIDNVLDGKFSVGKQHRISRQKYELLKKYAARPLDVLVTVMATVGRCCVVPSDIETAIITKHVYRITADQTVVNPFYLMQCIRGCPLVLAQVQSEIQGVTRPGINGAILKAIKIPLPPLTEQHEIIRRIESMFKLADAIEKRVTTATRKAEKLTQATLAKAFRGELVPTEAELARREGRPYESGSELLARIKSDGESKGGSKSVNRIRRSQRRLK